MKIMIGRKGLCCPHCKFQLTAEVVVALTCDQKQAMLVCVCPRCFSPFTRIYAEPIEVTCAGESVNAVPEGKDTSLTARGIVVETGDDRLTVGCSESCGTNSDGQNRCGSNVCKMGTQRTQAKIDDNSTK